jgi:hypothetical protein
LKIETVKLQQIWPYRYERCLMSLTVSIFKRHLPKREDLHPVYSGRQDPTEDASWGHRHLL